MNDAYYTQVGERPDLAAIEVNKPEGYIGTSIVPMLPTTDKSGTVYYATLTADSAAQTGRSAGAAPTATQVSDSSTTFSCAEAVKRAAITPDEAKQMGGIAKADEAGAKWAKRQVMNALEGAIRTDLFGVAATQTFDPRKFRTQAQTAMDNIRLYEGRSVLVLGTKTLKQIADALLGDAQVGPMFARIASGGSPNAAAAGFGLDAFKTALALWAGVDEVMAGDQSIWGAGAASGKCAIVKVDQSGDPLSHKYMPVLGKVFQFMPDGSNPWVISANANRDTINNTYDAFLWYDVVLLNTGAINVIDGIA